ncbi:MAG: hypothetical protein EOP61_08650 [Sphingomonadales bacterium]|nr:MAG: hypothetical protein EOP61_08650 [Sphingomonadales bacterium]
MLRGLIFCAIACSAVAPATAGERKANLPAVRAIAAPILVASLEFLGKDSTLTIEGDFVVRFNGAPAPSVALADFERRMMERSVFAAADSVEPASLYAAANVPALDAWHLTDGNEPVTASANGFYAVRDLMEHRKPRAFRPTPLSAMLVLRIDGRSDSPPISIGGGGVAAALWRIMPQ